MYSLFISITRSCSRFWHTVSYFLCVYWRISHRTEQGRTGLWECEMGVVLVFLFPLRFLFAPFCWKVFLEFLCWSVPLLLLTYRTCNASLSWCVHESGARTQCRVHRAVWSRPFGPTLLWAVISDCSWTGPEYWRFNSCCRWIDYGFCSWVHQREDLFSFLGVELATHNSLLLCRTFHFRFFLPFWTANGWL